MADRYAITGTQTIAASPGDTVLAVLASASTRGRLYHVRASHLGTMADATIQWVMRRLTAVGTEGAGVVPAAADSGAPAAQLDGAENHTAEPTYTSATELLDEEIHLRSILEWIAPGTPEEAGLVVPATANNGIGLTPIHASQTNDVRATMHYVE